MLKKTLCLFIFTTQLTFAETCPSIADIQTDNLQGWHVININNGLPATPHAIDYFKKNIQYFALAEWMKDAPEGEAHCYYYNQQKTDYLNVLLAKPALRPNLSTTAWQKLTANVLQCHADLSACSFQS
jgi:hypothetical protein